MTMMDVHSAERDNRLFTDVAEILDAGRRASYQTVNTILVHTYWRIGRRIVEEEQNGAAKAEYGQKLIVDLSRYLGERFGRGFSEANLKNMRQFFLRFPCEGEFATQCVANLSWSHIRQIMRIEDQRERDYYLKEAGCLNWTVRQLERNIRSGYYRRLLSSGIDPSCVLERASALDFIKDPYVLEFLGVPEDMSGKESTLEVAIIQHFNTFQIENKNEQFKFQGCY